MTTWSILSGTSWKSCVWGLLMWYLQWRKSSQDLDDVGLTEVLNCSWTKFLALRGCFACFWGHGAYLQKENFNKLTFLTFKFCIISPVCTFCPREQWTRRCFSVLMNLQPFAIAYSGRDLVFCKYESSTDHSVAKHARTFKLESAFVPFLCLKVWCPEASGFVCEWTTFLRNFFSSVSCNTGATHSLRPFIDVDLKLYEKHIHTWSTTVDCQWLSKVSGLLG